jgi:aminopeptidase YwaD
MSEENGTVEATDPKLPPEVVGSAYSSDGAWSALEDLMAFRNRLAGSAGEARAAEHLAGRFEAAGLREVETMTFDIDGWERGSSALTVGGERYAGQHEVLGLPGSPGERVEAPLVDAGHGTPEDIEAADTEGSILMISTGAPPDGEWRHRIEKFAEAVEAGAAGFVFRNDDPGCLPATGEVGFGDRPAEVPAVGVSAEVGNRIERALPTDAVIEVTCEDGPATSQNVSGVLGPDTEKEVLVTAHHDAHDIAECANDNGSGAAIMVALAELLADVEDHLDTAVRFVGHGSEEIGLLGSRDYAERADLDAVKCVLNVDVAGRSRTPAVKTNGFESISEGFEAATDRLGIDLETTGGITPHGDYWPFVARGVPAAMVHSASDAEGRGWAHTHADTLDKLDPRDLREMTIAVAEAVLEFASDDRGTPHQDVSEIRDRLGERYERELRLQDLWPYED